MTREKETFAHLKSTLERDRESMRTENQSFTNLQLDYIHLKEENMQLIHTREKVR